MSQQKNPSVLSTIVNWRRPCNIPAMIAAVRGQSVSSDLAIVDCAVGSPWELPTEVLDLADQVFTVRRNIGPSSRFIPPLAMPWYQWTMFYADDWLPGSRCLEQFLKWAELIQPVEGRPGFATLGMEGRRVRDRRWSKIRAIEETARRADVIVSAELVQTRDVPLAVEFAGVLCRESPHLSRFEDDLTLCLGIQRAVELPSLVIPSDLPHSSWRSRRLPAPFALSARPDHHVGRLEFIAAARRLGWESYT